MKSNSIRKVICLVLSAAITLSMVWTSDYAIAAKKASLKTKKITMKIGSSKTISIKNKNKKYTYTFKSSNTKVAKVTKKGKVTAINLGKAKITVKELKKVNKKTKTRILGVCNVTVKPKNVINPPIVTATPVTVTAAPTPLLPLATATPTMYVPKATSEPAYSVKTYSFDEDLDMFEGITLADGGKEGKAAVVKGSARLPMNKFMQYGGKCYVTGYFKQDSGSDKNITVAYNGTYLYFSQNGAYIDKNSMEDKDMEGSQVLSCPSGEWTKLEFSFDINKYSKDFNLTFSIQSGVDFMMDNVVVESEPCLRADYASMVAKSTRSTGNVTRIKKAMEKAKNGEDITIAYIGGSITEGFAASETNNAECYAETSCNLFREKYAPGDGSNVKFINAGMSGTPSSLGLVRYDRDVIAQNNGKPADILFIDYAVNDGGFDGEYYENLIRYALEQGSAVVLMFVLYSKGNGNENGYSKIGEHYDVAMVSPANGMSSCDKNSFDNWFYWSDGHPDVGGHRYMADCIMNLFDTVDGMDSDGEDVFSDIASKDMYTNNAKTNYVGMKTLEANTEVGGSILSIDKGSFTGTDKSQPTLQYIKDGVKDAVWFPNEISCPANSYTDSYKAKIKCNSMLIAYRANTGGKAEVYIDGNLVKTLSNTNSSWGHANIESILNDSNVAEHELEIKIADDSNGKVFTIYAIGYTNQEEFRSMK